MPELTCTDCDATWRWERSGSGWAFSHVGSDELPALDFARALRPETLAGRQLRSGWAVAFADPAGYLTRNGGLLLLSRLDDVPAALAPRLHGRAA